MLLLLFSLFVILMCVGFFLFHPEEQTCFDGTILPSSHVSVSAVSINSIFLGDSEFVRCTLNAANPSLLDLHFTQGGECLYEAETEPRIRIWSPSNLQD